MRYKTLLVFPLEKEVRYTFQTYSYYYKLGKFLWYTHRYLIYNE